MKNQRLLPKNVDYSIFEDVNLGKVVVSRPKNHASCNARFPNRSELVLPFELATTADVAIHAQNGKLKILKNRYGNSDVDARHFVNKTFDRKPCQRRGNRA